MIYRVSFLLFFSGSTITFHAQIIHFQKNTSPGFADSINTNSKFQINGYIDDLENGTVYLYDNSLTVLDSTEIQKGKFIFLGSTSEVASLLLKLKEDYYIFGFFVENVQMNIKMNLKDHSFFVTDGTQNEMQKRFSKKTESLIAHLNTLGKRASQAKEDLNIETYIEKLDSFNIFEEEYIKLIETEMENRNYGYYLLNAINAGGIIAYGYFDKRISLMKKLPDSILNSSLGKEVYDRLLLQKKKSLAWKNKKAFAFILNSGNPTKKVSLKNFRGKYVLLDFWASWCIPCLQELSFLKKIYTDHNPSKVVFMSISIDKEKQDWLKMEKKVAIPWISLLSTSLVTQKYDVQSVPYKVLIDKKGKIMRYGFYLDDLYKIMNTIR